MKTISLVKKSASVQIRWRKKNQCFFFNFCLFSKGSIAEFLKLLSRHRNTKSTVLGSRQPLLNSRTCDDKCFPIYLFLVCGHCCCLWLLKMNALVQIHSTAEPHISNHFHSSGFYLCVWPRLEIHISF